MPISDEVRRLGSTWRTNTGWPKRLNWLEIAGIRGWAGQRFELRFPIMAIVGENGVGKSTVLQCAASLYRSATGKKPDTKYASDFFPETPWDQVRDAEIRCEVREGPGVRAFALIKPTERWRRNPDRPIRHVVYVDLSRIQPVPARVGYMRLANPTFKEISAEEFERQRLARLSEIMGRKYDLAKMAMTNADPKRSVPVVSQQGAAYSGFHQGAGETTITELLQADLPEFSLVLIDEVESSLHPRAQRRLIKDLAAKCRELELQVVLTTHSPYVLDELPLEARAYIMQSHSGRREIIYGVSPEFAMTKMDDVAQYECDLYVEDTRAATMLIEILAAHKPDLVQRCRTIPYGASSVGQALGQMVVGHRFPGPSCVFLDGDQGSAPGCFNLPGKDAPERVVFGALQTRNWPRVAERVGREYAALVDICNKAMTLGDHHEWLRVAANALVLGTDTLWQAMCAEWATGCLLAEDARPITQPIEDVLIGVEVRPHPEPEPEPMPTRAPLPAATPAPSTTEPLPLFEQ